MMIVKIILFVKIEGGVADASNGSECGLSSYMLLKMMEPIPLVYHYDSTDGEVDVTIGAGSESLTTILWVKQLVLLFLPVMQY